jgi:hypothetical protein
MAQNFGPIQAPDIYSPMAGVGEGIARGAAGLGAVAGGFHTVLEGIDHEKLRQHTIQQLQKTYGPDIVRDPNMPLERVMDGVGNMNDLSLAYDRSEALNSQLPPEEKRHLPDKNQFMKLAFGATKEQLKQSVADLEKQNEATQRTIEQIGKEGRTQKDVSLAAGLVKPGQSREQLVTEYGKSGGTPSSESMSAIEKMAQPQHEIDAARQKQRSLDLATVRIGQHAKELKDNKFFKDAMLTLTAMGKNENVQLNHEKLLSQADMLVANGEKLIAAGADKAGQASIAAGNELRDIYKDMGQNTDEHQAFASSLMQSLNSQYPGFGKLLAETKGAASSPAPGTGTPKPTAAPASGNANDPMGILR